MLIGISLHALLFFLTHWRDPCYVPSTVQTPSQNTSKACQSHHVQVGTVSSAQTCFCPIFPAQWNGSSPTQLLMPPKWALWFLDFLLFLPSTASANSGSSSINIDPTSESFSISLLPSPQSPASVCLLSCLSLEGLPFYPPGWVPTAARVSFQDGNQVKSSPSSKLPLASLATKLETSELRV